MTYVLLNTSSAEYISITLLGSDIYSRIAVIAKRQHLSSILTWYTTIEVVVHEVQVVANEMAKVPIPQQFS